MTGPLPIGRTERSNEITRRGEALYESFFNGNRNYVRDQLLEMEPGAALAVLAYMFRFALDDEYVDLYRYFVEAA